MNVKELAKELGRTNRDILNILNHNHQNVANETENLSAEQVEIVKNTSASQAGRAVAADAPKKKIAAVFRTQNSQQKPARPKTAGENGEQASKPASAQESKPSADSSEQASKPAQAGASTQGGFNGNRDGGNRQGGFGGNRDGGLMFTFTLSAFPKWFLQAVSSEFSIASSRVALLIFFSFSSKSNASINSLFMICLSS